MTTDTLPKPCTFHEPGHCTSYAAGHQVHAIHAKHVGRTPWGWRDGVIYQVEGLWLGVQYVAEDHRLDAWHHVDLGAELRVGDPVRVHEQYYVLGSPLGWLSLVLRNRLGPVPVPLDLSEWRHQTVPGVSDLSTGRAVALDWQSARES